MFTTLDWIFLVLFLLFSTSIGLLVSKVKSNKKNFREYMFGGGKIPWVAVGISLIATSVSATTFLGAPADVFGSDMRFLMFQFGSLLSIIVVGIFFIPRFRNSGIFSAYELFEIKFSKTTRRLAALFYSLHLLLRTGILLYAPALVISQILKINIYNSILIMALLAIFYTWFGGIKAVIWTDVLQFIVFFFGGILVLYIIADSCGGFFEMLSMANASGKTKWFDSSFDLASDRSFISACFAYGILEIAIRGGDQQFVQRYLSCKSPKAANASSILSMVLGLLVSILFYFVGAALFVYYKIAVIKELPDSIKQNDVFPYFILNALPPGITGLIVAAICAAAMSSLSSAINALSHTTENDLLCLKKEQVSLKRAKLWTVLWGFLGIFAAFFAASAAGSLLKNALFFTGLFTGPLLAMFLISFFFKNVKSIAVNSGVLCGMLSIFLFNGIKPLNIPGIFENILSWPWMPCVSLTTTILTTLLLNFFISKFSK